MGQARTMRRRALVVVALTAGVTMTSMQTRAEPAPAVAAAPAAVAEGDWDGALALPGGIKLRLAVHIRTEGGVAHATWDSVDQGKNGLPVSAITQEGRRLRLEMAAAGAVFEGALSADGLAFDGQWRQSGQSFPLRLVRRAANAAAPAGYRRPQTPEPPFPYRAEEVAFDSAPGVRLAGTLTLPQGTGPFPVAVLIAGSGLHDRDETIFGHKPFLVLADALTRRGVAVLRYDKRGAGASTGGSADVTSRDYAADVRAAVAWLRGRPDIDPERIGLIGHSEGGTIAPRVADDDPKIAFVVMLAGSGAPGDEVIIAQLRAILLAQGTPPAQVDAIVALKRKTHEIAKSDLDTATEIARIEAMVTAAGAPLEAAKAEAEGHRSPWVRDFLRYDPRPALARLRCPVLALDGSKDLQVLADQNLPAIRAALKDDPDATVVELPGLNHLFQTAMTGAPSEYAEIEETLAPAALTLIVDWVVKRAGGGR